MYKMPIVNLKEQAKKLEASGKRIDVLWQHSHSIGFVARGREYRSEFHVNGSDEVMHMITGTMHLHFRTPEGKEDVAVIPEGASIFTPSGIPHSPRFPPDAFALITENRRKEGQIDEFHWYCPNCDSLLHKEFFVVTDYAQDPVSKAYARFFESEEFRTCKACGAVMPAP